MLEAQNSLLVRDKVKEKADGKSERKNWFAKWLDYA